MILAATADCEAISVSSINTATVPGQRSQENGKNCDVKADHTHSSEEADVGEGFDWASCANGKSR